MIILFVPLCTGVDLDTANTPGNSVSIDTVKLIFGNFSLPRKRRDHIRVHTAKLQLYFKNVNLRNDISGIISSNVRGQRSEDRGRAEIYHIVREPSRHDGAVNEIRQLLDVRPVSFSSGGWVSFDIKEAVQRWEQHKNAPFESGLEIILSRPELREALVLDTDTDLDKSFSDDDNSAEPSSRTSKYPRLDVTVREKPHRRSRRAVRPHPTRQGTDCERGESTCCRFSRTVSFADLEWDYWIVSPSEYNAYYCDGTCPQGHRVASTYALIKSQMHMVDPAQWNAPCCTASRLGSLPIMHYDHTSPERYTVTIMDDLIVEECMCM